jgi:hypothetical protein
MNPGLPEGRQVVSFTVMLNKKHRLVLLKSKGESHGY